MSDDFGFAPPPFKPEQVLVTLRRALRDLGLADRGPGFELRGKRVLELAVEGDTIRARIARRLMLTPEWDAAGPPGCGRYPQAARRGEEAAGPLGARRLMAQLRRDPDFERQRALAATLPGATEDIKWGADLVYSVGGKMFSVFLLDAGRAATCSFKVDDERFLELTDVPGVIPAPYLARAKWVQVGRVHGLTDADLDALVRRSHALVASRLTKKLQRDIGMDTGETTTLDRPLAKPGPHSEGLTR